ncbi:MAG: hypothetical protein RLZZ196_2657 [Bacteroidota bacterium]
MNPLHHITSSHKETQDESQHLQRWPSGRLQGPCYRTEGLFCNHQGCWQGRFCSSRLHTWTLRSSANQVRQEVQPSCHRHQVVGDSHPLGSCLCNGGNYLTLSSNQTTKTKTMSRERRPSCQFKNSFSVTAQLSSLQFFCSPLLCPLSSRHWALSWVQ